MTGKQHRIWRPSGSIVAILLMLSVNPCQAEFPAWIEQDKIRGTFDFSHVDKREHFAKLAAGGFNTILLAGLGLDHDQPDAIALIAKQAGWYAELNLHLFIGTRLCGAELERRHLVPGGRCYVTGAGVALTKTPCPIDPVFWDTVVTKRWQLIARQSLNHLIDGVFLDPEMYAADDTGFPGYCYCEDCFGEFMEQQGSDAALPAANARVDWLDTKGLVQTYRAFKQQRAQALARATQRAVHKINADLVLGVLMLDANNWYSNAWALGFGSQEMPVLAFSENTYGTGATSYIAQTAERFKQLGAHAVLCPGMWLHLFEVEDIAGHLFHMAQGSAGYWVFTTYGFALPPRTKLSKDHYSLTPPHEQYLQAFRSAGNELDRQTKEGERFVAKLHAAIRQASPRTSLAKAGFLGAPQVALRPLAASGKPRDRAEKPTLLRYGAVYYLRANAGQPITGELRSVKTGFQDKVPVYALIAPDGTVLAEGIMPIGQPIPLNVIAPETGLYKLAFVTQANLFAVQFDTSHAVLSIAEGVSVVEHANRMYFYVPPDVEEFRIEVATPYVAEQARLLVWDPSGKEAANVETFEKLPAIATLHPRPEQRGKVWSFQMLPTYSANLKWDRRLPPYLAEHPDALLVPIDR